MAADDIRPFRTEYPAKDGRTICLRPMEVADAVALQDVMSAPRAIWGTLQVPMTLPAKRRRMLEGNEESTRAWHLAAEIEGRVIGSGGLYGSGNSPRRAHAMGIGMMVHDDFQGIGVGTALMAAIVQLADEWLNLHRLELEVFVDNEPAIALYRRFGFEHEGTQRDYAFRGGRYVDSLVMGRIRPAHD